MAATVHNTSDWLSWPQRMDLPTYHTDKNSTLNACTSVGLTHAPQKLLEKKLCGCLQVCNICATFVGHEMFTYQNNTSFLAVLLPHGYLIWLMASTSSCSHLASSPGCLCSSQLMHMHMVSSTQL